MKYNLGCGNRYIYGWVNVDQFSDVKPDMVMNLERFPWPIEDDSADEVLMNHVLEHLGGTSDVFLGVMKELYRICKPNATVVIRVPNPRHDDFFCDPTHQRPILPGLFQTLDLASNEDWVSRGLPGTPLGKYLEIDFATTSVKQFPDRYWANKRDSKKISEDDLWFAYRSYNNAIQVSEIVLTARKPFSPGRSLRQFDAIVVQRWAGLGDVLMALSAVRAVRVATGLPILLYTSPEIAEFARLAPFVEMVSSDMNEIQAGLARLGLSTPRVLNWSAASYGISRFHQVDAYLLSVGLTLSDADKGIDIELPRNPKHEEIYAEIDRALSGSKRVVIHAGMTDPNRTWPESFWASLVDKLLGSGHGVILIGRSSESGRSVATLTHSGVVNLVDRLDYAGALGLLRRCEVLISNDSGPIQLAGATDIAIIGLYSVVDGANRLPYRHGRTGYKAIAVAPDCPFHPCYPRINDQATMTSFSAQEGISPSDTRKVFANWCINPDRFACTRERSTLDKVLAAVRQLSS